MHTNNEATLSVLYELRVKALEDKRAEHAEALLKAIELIGEEELLYENLKTANQKIEELEAEVKKLRDAAK
jgi:hypothetical protein